MNLCFWKFRWNIFANSQTRHTHINVWAWLFHELRIRKYTRSVYTSHISCCHWCLLLRLKQWSVATMRTRIVGMHWSARNLCVLESPTTLIWDPFAVAVVKSDAALGGTSLEIAPCGSGSLHPAYCASSRLKYSNRAMVIDPSARTCGLWAWGDKIFVEIFWRMVPDSWNSWH